MNEYCFFTSEGFTCSPTGKDLSNYQILGFASGVNEKEALFTLLLNNSWIKESGFEINKIESRKFFNT